ncbi:hypothetical protein TNCV_3689451 [Trichonephila clavipes]|uniref:Uncharacterized protein n=1 Tax=Trichonephila clavipes TaxID=2585209 RepID=A0A8X6SWS4_TRICX|nr:hypothetical protein TNCV_3689451 [Trichonephila clavipes]
MEIEVVSPSIVRSGNFAELNRTVTCMVPKVNNRRTSCPCHKEFRGPRSDYVRQWNRNVNNPADSKGSPSSLYFADRKELGLIHGAHMVTDVNDIDEKSHILSVYC